MSNKLLVIDTSRPFILLGYINGSKHVFEKVECGRNISTVLMDSIDSFLKRVGCSKDELDGVCCGRGPGAFTGIRLALSIAKTMSYALDIKLYSFSSLVIYSLFDESRKVISIDDARSYKMYYGIVNKDDIIVEEGIEEDPKVVNICDLRDDYKKISTKSFVNIETNVLEDFNKFNVNDFLNFVEVEDHFTFKPSYIKKLDCEV